MATIRNLTFRSRDLGDDVSLMLCFTPPGPSLYKDQFPIAWKVTTLNATGGSVLDVQWVSTIGICSTQSGSGNQVVAGTYIPIAPGQMSTLQRVGNSLKWTDPVNTGGITVKAKNGTDGPAGIGAGFITAAGTDNEQMNAAVLYDKVGQNLTVNAEFKPVLSAYVSLDFKENDVVRSEIIGVDPVWKDNLLGLGSNTTIWIRKTPQGGFKADVVAGNMGDVPRGLGWSYGAPITYRATLSFARPGSVRRTLEAIAMELIHRGYNVKTVTQEGDKEAQIVLGLPPHTSCDDAERVVLNSPYIPRYPLSVAIKDHSGERMEFASGQISSWYDISPASPEWFAADGFLAPQPCANVADSEIGNEETSGVAHGEVVVNGDAPPQAETATNGVAASIGEATEDTEALKTEVLRPKTGTAERLKKNRTLRRKATEVFQNPTEEEVAETES